MEKGSGDLRRERPDEVREGVEVSTIDRQYRKIGIEEGQEDHENREEQGQPEAGHLSTTEALPCHANGNNRERHARGRKRVNEGDDPVRQDLLHRKDDCKRNDEEEDHSHAGACEVTGYVVTSVGFAFQAYGIPGSQGASDRREKPEDVVEPKSCDR